MKKLIHNIIPPNDYKHRNGFSNKKIIDGLTIKEKCFIEDALIDLLKKGNEDLLIVQTLAYLKSKKSLPYLYKRLKDVTDYSEDIILGSCIFYINRDSTMIDIVLENFRKIENKYCKINAFYDIRKFNEEKTNNEIKKYIENSDHLVAYNAKRALNFEPEELW